MEDKYKGFKVIKLDSEYPVDYIDSWNVIGVRDDYVCPECEYLGTMCDKCKGDNYGIY